MQENLLTLWVIAWICLGVLALTWMHSYSYRQWMKRLGLRPRTRSKTKNIITKILGAFGSTNDSVHLRLQWAFLPSNLLRFRIIQLLATLCLGFFAFALALAASFDAWMLISATVLACYLGVFLPDYVLSQLAHSRQRLLDETLPDAVELLSLAVGAGEGLGASIIRITPRCSGPVGTLFHHLSRCLRSGRSLGDVLNELAKNNCSTNLTNLVEAINLASTRGTALGGVLRTQVVDGRERARSELMQRAGRKEILMMTPIVFLVLPLTILFALIPTLGSFGLLLRFG